MSKFADSPEYAQYSDYEEFSVAELYGDSKEEPVTVQNEDGTLSVVSPEAPEEPKIEVVGIRFKSSGKTYYFAPGGVSLHVGSHAIVETARGLEYGEVAIANTLVNESETVPPLRPVIRKATDADIKHHEENKEKEDAAFRICNEKIIAHGLDMKLIDAQYTFDNTKLLFYFTSSGRVDFRELVKDLASVFRTRIELRQIGIRDEAKMVGGLGLCGRPLCCSLFLSDFGQVSIKMAKEQNLSLNSSKISGICGRLMCCLRYEHDTYEYEIKRTPPVDSLVRTVDGVGVVTEINPLAATIKVKLTASPDTPPKSYHRDDVTVLKKKENS
ncbi:MAG: stage 0 sporulation family protein [Clostridia bacterium]|nr:stage 0 sporulation family protein [Clostridia bacterium]